MKGKMILVLLFAVIFNVYGSAEFGPYLEKQITSKSLNDTLKIWVFFTDKGFENDIEYKKALQEAWDNMTPKKRQRLAEIGKYADFVDVPVCEDYINKLSEYGKIKRVSRFLNAVSIIVPVYKIYDISNLPFVNSLEIVMKYKTNKDVFEPLNSKILVDTADYGYSFQQNAVVGIDRLHNVGITGKNVLIGIMDSGFQLTHKSLKNTNVIWQYDFVFDDDYTGYDPLQDQTKDQIDHGTAMLSLLSSYDPVSMGFIGRGMVGAAFGASYAIAKTENVFEENITEEDNWVAAFESFDSLGVDIISSSLAYKAFDNDSFSYSYSQMDGRTAITSHTASTALSRGILLFNAVGNRPMAECDIDTMIPAPADAYDIIAVGGCDEFKYWWDGSLKGPTYDGRQRPQIIAPSSAVMAAYAALDDSSFTFVTGTSAGTAIAAGGAALIKSAHPDWTPEQIMSAIFDNCVPPVQMIDDITGDTIYWWDPDTIPAAVFQPSDTVGYGIPDFYNAVFADTAVTDTFTAGKLGEPYPNPFYPQRDNYVCIPFYLDKYSKVELRIYSSSGKLVRTLNKPEGTEEYLMIGSYLSNDQGDQYSGFLWDGLNDNGMPVASGIYYIVWDNHFTIYRTKVVVIR